MAQQKIWVVDDDPVNAVIVTQALENKGYDVEHIAFSAADAIAKINTVSAVTPDKPLILTDNDMEHNGAGMKVLEAATKKNLKSIMMSAYDVDAEARKNGAADFWKKDTADLPVLVAKVDAAVAPPGRSIP